MMDSFSHLKYVFMNEDRTSFSSLAHSFLDDLPNPYVFFDVNIKKEMKLYKDSSSFPAQFLIEFEKFVAIKKEIIKLLTPSLQKSAFMMLKEMEDPILQEAIVNCFLLSSVPHIILPLLLFELQTSKNKSFLCNLLIKLNFPPKATTYGVIVPLFLQDNIGLAEKLVDLSCDLQKDFLHILDDIVGNQIMLTDLFYTCNSKKIKALKSPKAIYNLGMRLMKKYNMANICPYILSRHKLSSLRYLVHKWYSNELSSYSLLKFCEEICNGDAYLISEVVNLFIDYNDYLIAVKFLENNQHTPSSTSPTHKIISSVSINALSIPFQDIPYQIQEFLKDQDLIARIEQLEISKENEQNKYKQEYFYQLSLPLSSVYTIKTVKDFDAAIDEIERHSIIGIDTESKPNLLYEKKEELMLIQIAVPNKVFLFDVLYLRDLLSSGWSSLSKLFSDTNIQKLTYSSADIKLLQDLHPILKRHLNNVSNLIDLHQVKKYLLISHPELFDFESTRLSENNHKGLSELVFLCFGKPLDKMEQCSYWSGRPLSESQIVYAALDAFCLLDIYNYLNQKSKILNIPDWSSAHLSSSQTPQSSKGDKKKAKVSVTCKKNKKSANNCPVKSGGQKVSASDFKVVCDSMLQGLGKRLRCCNIDTFILNSHDCHDKCIELYEKEFRVVLTRGNVYHRLAKYIPQSHILFIENDTIDKQLKQVATRFKVVIEESDLLSRCYVCNHNNLLSIEPKIISQIKLKRGKLSGSRWVTVDRGQSRIDIIQGVTDKGVKISSDEIAQEILNRVSCIYVCDRCGKCYWDGSHRGRLHARLAPLIFTKSTE